MTALKLKQLGYDPILLDEGKKADRTIAQSLSPGVFTLLETVGVSHEDCLESCHPVSRSVIKWESEVTQTTTSKSYLTDRIVFDRFLLSKAIEKGITVLPSRKVVSLKQNLVGWDMIQLCEGIYSTHKTSFLIDASGNKSLIRGSKKRVAAPTLCISGCWENTMMDKNETRIESGNNHWIWGAVLPDGILHASVPMDSASGFEPVDREAQRDQQQIGQADHEHQESNAPRRGAHRQPQAVHGPAIQRQPAPAPIALQIGPKRDAPCVQAAIDFGFGRNQRSDQSRIDHIIQHRQITPVGREE